MVGSCRVAKDELGDLHDLACGEDGLVLGLQGLTALWGSRMQHMPLASGYRRSPVVRHDRRHVAAALSVAVVVILGHPPEVDLVDNVADTGESVLGNWSRADELVLFEGPSSWEVVVDHLAHLRAETFLIEICTLCCTPARTQPRSHPILDRVPTRGGGPCRSQ